MLEDAQLKSKVTEPILSDATLLVTSTKAVFILQEYPNKTREWEREAKAGKTWLEWKLFYKKAYDLQQLAFQYSDRSNQFGATNATTQA